MSGSLSKLRVEPTKSRALVNRSTSDFGKSDDDDRPKPMRNSKPSQKFPNASDRFYSDHQEEYEARGKQGDRIAIVEEHNSGYPKMRAELDKRKSTSKPTAETAARDVGDQGHNPRCPICGRYKKHKQPKRKYQRTKSRITKRKPRALKSYRTTKTRRNKAMTTLISKTLVTNNSRVQKDKKYHVAAPGLQIKSESDDCSRKSDRYSRKSDRDSKNPDVDSKNPDAHPKNPESIHTVSSYDSFLSDDHEPMDTW